MDLLIPIYIAALGGVVAGAFSLLAFIYAKRAVGSPQVDTYETLLREESGRDRQAFEDAARTTRSELAESIQRLQDSIMNAFSTLGNDLRSQMGDFGKKLDSDMKTIREEANANREAFWLAVSGRLDDASLKQATMARETREELSNKFTAFEASILQGLNQYGEHQKERLENVGSKLAILTESMAQAQESLKKTVEDRLNVLRDDNAKKLEEMRQTVDEKLQSTLEARLGESFNRVVEHLKLVHDGIGQMKVLAADVGDLSRVLTNVKVRGTLGEVQLDGLLEQFLAPEQYEKNVQVKEHSQERVEFAIKMPGRVDSGDVLLPIDAKFPREDYDRLLLAIESNDPDAVAEARKGLESRIRASAKAIRDKYINSPRTTDFAILFLPLEGLFAEAINRPGIFEGLHREYRVTLAGPTTLSALLNSLQMGFKSLALEKRSSEVWQVLAGVQSEFSKYNAVVEKLGRQLNTAANSVGELGRRTRVMTNRLRAVERNPGVSPILVSSLPVEVDGEPDSGNTSVYDELNDAMSVPEDES